MSNDAVSKKSRRRFLKVTSLLLVSSAGGAVLTACGANATPTVPAATAAPTVAPTVASTVAPTTAAVVAPTAAKPTVAATTASTASYLIKSDVPGVPDVYLKLPPLFKATQGVPGKGGTVTSIIQIFDPVPAPRNENSYWKELEKRIGVEKWEPTLVPSASYTEKLNVVTASGNLPDLVILNADQRKVIQQGAYTDLTPFLSGDALKEFPNIAAYPPQLWKNVAIDGKIYGVPRPRFLQGQITQYRKDWAQKLGFSSQPKNADEFLKLLEAMTKNDPDGNGSNDTWGLAISSGAPTYSPRIIMEMFRVPNRWRLNPDGSLTSMYETPEYKEAIAFTRRLREAGVLHPDSFKMNQQSVKDALAAGKIGMIIDSTSSIDDNLEIVLKINPKAEMANIIPFGHDGGKAVHWGANGFLGFTGIPAKVGKDKEKVKELLRILNYFASPVGSEEYIFIRYGLEGVHHTVNSNGEREQTELGKKEIGNGSVIALVAEPNRVLYFPEMPGLAQSVQNTLKAVQPLSIDDPTETAFSATWGNKSRELNQLVNDRILRILSGQDPVSAVDDMVKEFKSRGGDQTAKEFAESIKKA
jgi:putative aldouronate transport system substrate-binding protein